MNRREPRDVRRMGVDAGESGRGSRGGRGGRGGFGRGGDRGSDRDGGRGGGGRGDSRDESGELRRRSDPNDYREPDMEDAAAIERQERKKERKSSRKEKKSTDKAARIQRQEEWARANRQRRAERERAKTEAKLNAKAKPQRDAQRRDQRREQRREARKTAREAVREVAPAKAKETTKAPQPPATAAAKGAAVKTPVKRDVARANADAEKPSRKRLRTETTAAAAVADSVVIAAPTPTAVAAIRAPSPNGAAAAPTKYVPPAMRKAKKGISEAVRAVCNKLTVENVVAMSLELGALFDSGRYARAEVLAALNDMLSLNCIHNPSLTPISALSYAGFIRGLQLAQGNDTAATVFAHLAAELRVAVMTVGAEQAAIQSGSLIANMYLVHCCDSVLPVTLLNDLLNGSEGNYSSGAIQCALAVMRIAGGVLRATAPSAMNGVATLIQQRAASSGGGVTRDAVLADLVRQLALGKTEGAANQKGHTVDATALATVIEALTAYVRQAHPTLIKRAASKAVETMNTVGFSWRQAVTEMKPPRWYTLAPTADDESAPHQQLPTASRRIVDGEDEGEQADEPAPPAKRKRSRKDDDEKEEEVEAPRAQTEAEAKRLVVKMMRDQEKAGSGQRFSTEAKRQIFNCIVSSSDDMECFTLLSQRDPTGATLSDVAAVLVQCCCQEEVFNPFYVLTLHRLLSAHKKMKNLAQYAIWDRFKSMRFEAPDAVSYLNLACMVCYLLQNALYGLALLRGLDLEQPSRDIHLFVRILLLRLLTAMDPRAMATLFFGGDVVSGNVVDFNVNTTSLRKALTKVFQRYVVTEEESKRWIPPLWDVVTFDLVAGHPNAPAGAPTKEQLISSLPERIDLVRRALRDGI